MFFMVVRMFFMTVLMMIVMVMGMIFMVSRIWDAVSDPLAGYLSDRTRSRFGRRRVWILGSIVPIAATFIMVFAPPQGMAAGALTAWMTVAIVGFYSATTVLLVPHLALGAELSGSYHERSRLFGIRHAFFTFGAILALYSFYLLIRAEQQGSGPVRDGSSARAPRRSSTSSSTATRPASTAR